MAEAFPVEAFCEEVAYTGAKWLIFPFGQNNRDGYDDLVLGMHYSGSYIILLI